MNHKYILLLVILLVFITFQTAHHEEPLYYEIAILPEAFEVQSSTWIDLQSVRNARQPGGFPTKSNRVIKQNKILRTGELSLLTNEDKDILINEYGLTHIIDLRDEAEVLENPDPLIEGVQYHHLIVWPREVRIQMIIDSITPFGIFDQDLYEKNYYAAFALGPAAIESYKEMFNILLQNQSGSILVHCVHGKDRAGVAVALILSALDVEWAVIEQDYLLSNASNAGSVNISSLRYYKNVIEEKYGSLEIYLEAEMNLRESELTALKEKYTIDD